MCRMLLALGNFETAALIDDFKILARDQNERHEENATGVCLHEHGWGIIYEEKNELKFYKSPNACFRDDQFKQFQALNTSFLVLHARRNTKGVTGYNNSHPFWQQLNGQPVAFCHNGTIYDQFTYAEKFQPLSTVDSEYYFSHILTHLVPHNPVQSYLQIIQSIENYSSLNSFLIQQDHILVVNKYKINPNYYTMKMSVSEESILICSEVLPGFKERQWKKLANNTLIELNRRGYNWNYQKWDIPNLETNPAPQA